MLISVLGHKTPEKVVKRGYRGRDDSGDQAGTLRKINSMSYQGYLALL